MNEQNNKLFFKQLPSDNKKEDFEKFSVQTECLDQINELT